MRGIHDRPHRLPRPLVRLCRVAADTGPPLQRARLRVVAGQLKSVADKQPVGERQDGHLPCHPVERLRRKARPAAAVFGRHPGRIGPDISLQPGPGRRLVVAGRRQARHHESLRAAAERLGHFLRSRQPRRERRGGRTATTAVVVERPCDVAAREAAVAEPGMCLRRRLRAEILDSRRLGGPRIPLIDRLPHADAAAVAELGPHRLLKRRIIGHERGHGHRQRREEIWVLAVGQQTRHVVRGQDDLADVSVFAAGEGGVEIGGQRHPLLALLGDERVPPVAGGGGPFQCQLARPIEERRVGRRVDESEKLEACREAGKIVRAAGDRQFEHLAARERLWKEGKRLAAPERAGLLGVGHLGIRSGFAHVGEILPKLLVHPRDPRGCGGIGPDRRERRDLVEKPKPGVVVQW